MIPDRSPSISVVIPAYNAAAFIEKALDSVRAQTYPPCETIVVDDGSVDATAELVERWANAYPKIRTRLLRQANKGVGAARNAGIRAAGGEYVAFLDADDLWLTRKLETVIRRLNVAVPADLICHDERLEGVGRRSRRLTHGPYTTYRDMLLKGNTLSPSATVVRRQKLLDVGGFSEDLQFNSAEDYELWLRLARSGCRIEYLHEVLGVFRQDGQGITSKIEMHCEHWLNVLELHFGEWQRKTLLSRYLMRRHRAAILRGACHELMHRGEHREARRFLRRALREDPLSWKTWAVAVVNLALLTIEGVCGLVARSRAL